jgi:hypothetical protein
MLFYLIWFITAFLILGTPFLLMPTRYHCTDRNFNACRELVCQLSLSERKIYQIKSVNSLINHFPTYDCEGEVALADFKLPLFIGIFAGYIGFTYYSDNFGRRRAMLLTWFTAIVGLILICLGKSPTLAGIGLFLAGAGCESNLRVNLAIISEIVDYHLRQAYSIILQSAFGVAGLAIAASYYCLHDWQIVTLICCVLPAIVVMLGIIFRLEETP